MNIKINAHINPWKVLHKTGIITAIAAGSLTAAGHLNNKNFITSRKMAETMTALALFGSAGGIKGRYQERDDNITGAPIKELTDEEFKLLEQEIALKKLNLNDKNQVILNQIPLNKYNIQCLNRIIDDNDTFYRFYNALSINNINSAKFFDYELKNKDLIKEKIGPDFIYYNVHKTIKTPKELEFKIKLLEYAVNNSLMGKNIYFPDIIMNSKSMPEAFSMLEHVMKYGVLPSCREYFNRSYGTELSTKMLDEIAEVKNKFNIEINYLDKTLNKYSEPYIVLTGGCIGEGDSFLFKFNPETGKLIFFEHNNTIYNFENKTKTTVINKTAADSEELLDASIEVRDFDNDFLSKSSFTQSKIIGEFDCDETNVEGKTYKTSLTEVDKQGGEHIEKHFTSPDGTVTDYIFANDRDGNRYLYYKITDNNKKVLYESKKKFTVLSENHFCSEVDGKYYDIVFYPDRVVISSMKDRENKIEYKFKEYQTADYKTIENIVSEVYHNKRMLENLKNEEITLGQIVLEKRVIDKFTIDKKAEETLKYLGGEEWFSLKNSNVFTIISDWNKTSARSLGNGIQIGQEKNLLSVIEHEIGHEKARVLELERNQELKQIYEYEKNLFIKTLPDIAIRQAEYFLMNSPKSLGEVLAETNLIINAPQKWNGIGTRTMFLQQYFPKTIAFIAKEYEKLY